MFLGKIISLASVATTICVIGVTGTSALKKYGYYSNTVRDSNPGNVCQVNAVPMCKFTRTYSIEMAVVLWIVIFLLQVH